MALKSDGTLWAWGYNGYGQLGDNTNTNRAIPVQVKNPAGNGYMTDIKTLAIGDANTYILKNDGTVWAMGYNGDGRLGDNTTTNRWLPTQVRDAKGTGYLTNITAIAAGYQHGMALKNDGSVWAWGVNGGGRLGDNTLTQRNIPVQVRDTNGNSYLTGVAFIGAIGYSSYAQTSDGSLWSWGQNNDGQLGNGTVASSGLPVRVRDYNGQGCLGNVSSLAGGDSHVIVLRNDGFIWGWGRNDNGQLGDGTYTGRLLPVRTRDLLAPKNYGELTGVVAIYGGGHHTLALKNDGSVWAWGYNAYGSLGDNTVTHRNVPVRVRDDTGRGYLSGVSMLAAGRHHTLALKNDGTVWAWGFNNNGQLGDNTTSQRNFPVQVKDSTGTSFLTGIISVAAHEYFSLALKNDGTVWAWGNNANGQLGDNTTTQRNLPVQVKGLGGTDFLTDVKSICAGLYHSAVIKNDGAVWAWGRNNNGQLGDNTTTQRNTPVQVLSSNGVDYLNGVASLSAGYHHTLALKNDGTMLAWGNNGSGQLGDNTNVQRLLPVPVKDAAGTGLISNVVDFAAVNDTNSVALKSDGTVWAWGNNNYGQLGTGEALTTQRWLPMQVRNGTGSGYLSGIKSIESRLYNTLALTNEGTIKGWGYNYNGELADGTFVPRIVAVSAVDDAGAQFASGVSSIVSGDGYTLMKKNDGTVLAVGRNDWGQLGDTTRTGRSTAALVKDATGLGYLTDVKAVSTKDTHSLAVKNDGTVWTWGYNNYGQLGINDTSQTYKTTPVQVIDSSGTGYLRDVADVSAGSSYSVVLKKDGTVWAWGANADGRVGDGGVTIRLLPTQVKDSTGNGYLTNVVAVKASPSFAMALKSDGTLWAWGNNSYGQLGDNTTINRSLPVQVKNPAGNGYMTDVKTVALGDNQSYILKNDGTVWALGYNGDGRLGDNTITNRWLPTQVKDSTGTSYLTGITSIAAGYQHGTALKNDGTVWAWGLNGSGRLGDATNTNRMLPVQVKDYSGAGYLSNVSSLSNGIYSSFALRNDGSVWGWGQNSNNQLGDGGNTDKYVPVQVQGSLETYQPKFASSGSASGYIVDLGAGRRTKWQQLTWNSQALPINTSISFTARTSNDGIAWSSWLSNAVQNTAGSSTGTADLVALDISRYIDVKVTLNSLDHINAPTVTDFTLTLLNDTTAPLTNASSIQMKDIKNGSTVSENAWLNKGAPYFSWTAGADDISGTGIGGYCLYLGQDDMANVAQTKGLLGSSPYNTDGVCQYAVEGTELDLAAQGALASPLTSSNNAYYLLVKAIDKAGNVYEGDPAKFAFRYDNTPPGNISFLSLPSQFVPTKDITITWPTSGTQTASDANSGLVGLQYRIGNDGTWYGAAHNGKQDSSDVLPVSAGTYQTDATYDYPLLTEGNNIIYFRSLDAAGNFSSTITSAVIKINTSSPSSPQNVTATPATNTTNSFGFSWQPPATYVGQATNLSYCYTINTTPTENTCTFTSPGQTSLIAGAYATQPGENTFYVVARDEAGNINYATYASVVFKANTSAPGIPLNMEIADVSVKSTQSWKLAVSWESPTDTGAGVANYRVYRSSTSATDGFTQIATTQGNSYVDTKLNAVTYYYKVRACDSANNCGAESSTVNKLPTGRYTSPAELSGAPTVVIGSRKATISWYTARGSDSKIQIGTESGKYRASETYNSNQDKAHQLVVDGLDAGTTYYYKAKWTDEDGNTGSSGELMFTTLPAPVVSNVKVVKTNLTTATISFTSRDAKNVKLNFGKTNAFGGFKSINTSASESTYTVELDALDDGSTYYFRPDATDLDGFTYEGNVFLFNTPPRPRITNLRFQPIAGEPTSTQRVTWSTNVPTSSIVTYGLEGANGLDILDSKLVTEHAITVKDLKDDSSYFLLAQSRDADGNLAVSDRQTFRTAMDTRAPKVSDVNVEATIKGTGAEARGQVVITWKTDEPATSQVFYNKGSTNGSYSNSTIEDTRLMTEHTVVISDLSTSSVYYVKPLSHDNAGNQAATSEESAIIGRPTDNVLTIILNALYRTFGL